MKTLILHLKKNKKSLVPKNNTARQPENTPGSQKLPGP